MFYFLFKQKLPREKLKGLLIKAILVSSDNLSGGLWLIQKNSANFDHDIIFSSSRFIHTLITDRNKNICWYSTFIYGFPQHHLQKRL